MRNKLQIVLAFLLCYGSANASADLTFSSSITVVNPPNPVHIGITINVKFSVLNIGSSTAGATHTGIYISPTTSWASGKLLSEISLESLAPGAASNDIQFSFPITYDALIGNGVTYYIIVRLNDDNAITEGDYTNNVANTIAPITVNHSAWAAQNIPYPIIFVHGYMSDNTTWQTMIDSLQNFFGWSYGGNMDFCLNEDGNVATSNITPSNIAIEYHDFTGEQGHTLNPNPSDFYSVNFAVNPTGISPYNNSIESNQAAITKQGRAIQDAIKHVLDITKKDKVILVCHSMGGLAAREYLQNPNLFQSSDGEKHVAKLCTIGTPHGGTNIAPLDLGKIYSGYDTRSEAIRDLRTSYAISNRPGTYLFSGKENVDSMNDGESGYYNVNVNCNEIASGESIVGINKKDIPNNLTYSCIVGSGDNIPVQGDGVVTEYSANLNNFRQVNASVFTIGDSRGILWNPFDPWHIELPKQFSGIMQGLDEPTNDKIDGHAYEISSAQFYYGNITFQSVTSPLRDSDSYVINVGSMGNLNVQVYSITTPVYSINIFNSSGISVGSLVSNGKSYISKTVSVTQGTYKIVLSGIPTPNSYRFPYAFKCTFTPSLPSCNGTTNLTANSGTLSDGSDTSNYKNYLDCRWLIQPAGAKSITLSFSNFTVNKLGDTLYVYDGASTSSPILRRLTGTTLPNNVKSTGGIMLLRFSTNNVTTAAGWNASYTSTFPPDTIGIVKYESWFDNDYAHKKTTQVTSQKILQLTSTISTTTVNNGLHSFHIRFADKNSKWSSVISQFFIKMPQSSNNNSISSYEYWFDSSYSNKVTQPVNSQNPYNLNTAISISGISQGLHSFHIRFKDSSNTWSSLVSQFIFYYPSTDSVVKINRYEYWFDNNYAQRVFKTVSPTGAKYTLNTSIATSSLSNGTHSFHIRFRQYNNLWSSVLSQNFNKASSSSIALSDLSGDKFEYNKDNQIFVYPNPSSGKFAVSIDDSIAAKSISIMDALGKRIYYLSIEVKNKKDVYTLDLSKATSGTYYLNVYDGKKNYKQKIVFVK